VLHRTLRNSSTTRLDLPLRRLPADNLCSVAALLFIAQRDRTRHRAFKYHFVIVVETTKRVELCP
jgi:aminopeptidase-like protein